LPRSVVSRHQSGLVILGDSEILDEKFVVKNAGDKAGKDLAYEGDHTRMSKIFNWCEERNRCMRLGLNPIDKPLCELITESVYAAQAARKKAEAAELRAQCLKALSLAHSLSDRDIDGPPTINLYTPFLPLPRDKFRQCSSYAPFGKRSAVLLACQYDASTRLRWAIWLNQWRGEEQQNQYSLPLSRPASLQIKDSIQTFF
jgi:hypothetical protein